MAVDTRDKRASVLGLALSFALVLPNPDGLALDQGDRQQVAYSYRGIAAASPIPVEAPDGEIIYVPAEDRTFTVPFEDRTFLAPVRPTP